MLEQRFLLDNYITGEDSLPGSFWFSASDTSGRIMVNVVPWLCGSLLLLTLIVPPHDATNWRTTHSPSPVPALSLVVKKGSKRRGIFSAGMPSPVSSTATSTPG